MKFLAVLFTAAFFLLAGDLFISSLKAQPLSRQLGADGFVIDARSFPYRAVTLYVPQTLTFSYSLAFPSSPPSGSLSFLATDANGNMSWATNLLPPLPFGNIWVGNNLGVATPYAPTVPGAVFILDPTGKPVWSTVVPGVVTTTQGTAPITVNGDNATHSGAVTVGVTTGSLTSSGSTMVVTGAGNTVGGNINAEINLGHANNWTGTQTFNGEAHVPVNAPLGGASPVNDYALGTANSYYRISSSAPINLTGFQNGTAGRTIVLQNVGSFPITLKSQTSSASGNQFDLPGGADIVLGSKGSITLIYDGTLNLWEIVSTN